jgi:hypothetical protein
MYTFDYKDEHWVDSQTDGCDSMETDEAMGTLSGQHPTSPATAADGREHSKSDRELDQVAHLSSVRVYAIADKYDIPRLKELAQQRFSNWAENNWACHDFSAIAREVFETTPTSDRGLRDVVIRLVAMHADDLIRKKDSRNLIEDVGDLGLNVLCQLLKTHSEEKSALKARVKALEAETVALDAQVKKRDAQIKEQGAQVKKLDQLLQNSLDLHYGSSSRARHRSPDYRYWR